jgi:hypothetical protein
MHVIHVENRSAESERFAFRVTCECGWVARAFTEQEATLLGDGHVLNQQALAAKGGIRQGGL